MMNSNPSNILIVDSGDTAKIKELSVLFPKLTSLILKNEKKNFVINFKDGERSLIVMVVCKSKMAIAS